VRAPSVYNPYFERAGIDAVVVPIEVSEEAFPSFVRTMFRATNVPGALVTVPHKRATVDVLDDYSDAVRVAGACNAIVRRPDGTLYGDLFDGAGFVRGLQRWDSRRKARLPHRRLRRRRCRHRGGALPAPGRSPSA
jgi:shikimate dehydrogenase